MVADLTQIHTYNGVSELHFQTPTLTQTRFQKQWLLFSLKPH